MGNYFQPFSLRMTKELLEKIENIAKINMRSSNKEMEFALKQYVNKWEKEKEISKK